MALSVQQARTNLVKAYRDLGAIQDSGTVPTAATVRRAEGRLHKALADFYESVPVHMIDVYQPAPAT